MTNIQRRRMAMMSTSSIPETLYLVKDGQLVNGFTLTASGLRYLNTSLSSVIPVINYNADSIYAHNDGFGAGTIFFSPANLVPYSKIIFEGIYDTGSDNSIRMFPMILDGIGAYVDDTIITREVPAKGIYSQLTFDISAINQRANIAFYLTRWYSNIGSVTMTNAYLTR